jgi:uncharacterized membrane protein
MMNKIWAVIRFTFKDMIKNILERIGELSKSLAVVTSIGAVIAITILLGALQLDPSAWKTLSVVSSIVSSMLFLSSAILYGFSPPEVVQKEVDSRYTRGLVAAGLIVFYTIAGFFALVIGLGCFVGSENWEYAAITLLTGTLPLFIFWYLAYKFFKE